VEEERFKTQLLIPTIWWKWFCKRTVVSEYEPNVSLMVHEGTQVGLYETFFKIGILKDPAFIFGFNSGSWKGQ